MNATTLVAGAAGNVGRLITSEVARTGARTRAGLRGGSAHKLAGELLRIDGVEIVDLDLTRPDTLHRALEGVDVVVSAVQGGPDILIDGQVALASAALVAGAKRIFPSDFAVDFSAIPPKDHLFFSWRRLGQQAIAATGLAQTNTYNGAFAEVLLPHSGFDLLNQEDSRVHYWGSSTQAYDFTATADVARFVAAATQDPNAPEGPLRVAGDARTPAQIADIATRISGREFLPMPLGTLDELSNEIDRRHEKDPQDPMAWVGLQYVRSMASGAGKLNDTHNHLYPTVVPKTVEEFLRSHDG